MPVQLVRRSTPPVASGREARLQGGLRTEDNGIWNKTKRAGMVSVTQHSNMPVTSNIKYGNLGTCVCGRETNRENSFGYNVMEFANQYFTPKLTTACIEQNAILKHMVCTGICFLL